MKVVFVLSLMCIALLTSACAKDGGTLTLTVQPDPAALSSVSNQQTSNNGGSTTTKSLLSLWTEQSGSFSINLGSARIGTKSPVTIVYGAQSCSCQALINGSETAGTVAVSGCDGVCGATSFSLTGNYTKSSNALQVCETSTSCYGFK
jgi:hypothetical protein